MTGCSHNPTVIPFEQDKLEIIAEQPMDKCVWPELTELELNGQTIIYMDEDGLKLQRSCQITEQANFIVAQNNAGSVDDVISAFNKLIDKAQLHNNYAQNELTRVDDERQKKSMEVLGYQGLIAIILVAIAL